MFRVGSCRADDSKPYKYVPVKAFVDAFEEGTLGQRRIEELGIPYDRATCPPNSLECALARPHTYTLRHPRASNCVPTIELIQ